MDVESVLQAVTSWAETRSNVVGLALVGSLARGDAGLDSDVDLILLCTSPGQLLKGDWASQFGEVQSTAVEHYGAVTSLRVFYVDGPEVEFGITTPSWAWLPLDPGTRGVLSAGCRVLYDPEGLLERARENSRRDPRQSA